MYGAAGIERNSVSEHRIQPGYGDEQADAGRNYRNRLARPISQARNREIFIFPVQLNTSRIGNLTRLILTLAICDDRSVHRVNKTLTQKSSHRNEIIKKLDEPSTV